MKNVAFFSSNVSLESLLHPSWLQVLQEHDISGCYAEPKNRFVLELKSRHLLLEVSKELYEKLGIEGHKVDKEKSRFKIDLDLQDEKICTVGHKFRVRLLEIAGKVLKDQMKMNFACSLEAFSKLKMATESYALEQEAAVLELPALDFDISSHQIPESDDLEDLNLWVGSIVTSSNLLLSKSNNLDPFIGTCRLPEGQPHRITHIKFTCKTLFPTWKISELLESLCSLPDWKNLFIVGQSFDDGFSMTIDNARNFLFVSVGSNR